MFSVQGVLTLKVERQQVVVNHTASCSRIPVAVKTSNFHTLSVFPTGKECARVWSEVCKPQRNAMFQVFVTVTRYV